jgi:hypothetical protein
MWLMRHPRGRSLSRGTDASSHENDTVRRAASSFLDERFVGLEDRQHAAERNANLRVE